MFLTYDVLHLWTIIYLGVVKVTVNVFCVECCSDFEVNDLSMHIIILKSAPLIFNQKTLMCAHPLLWLLFSDDVYTGMRAGR